MTVQYADTPNVKLAYETFGDANNPAIVMIHRLGTQMIGWQDAFLQSIADEGYFVVRFDNRDIGLSTHLSDAGTPGLAQFMAKELVTESASRLADMADDVAGVLDALGLEQANIVGASMGGLIAQEFVIRHPQRVLSLTSIFSTPTPHIGAPTPEAWGALMLPPATNEADAADRSVTLYGIIGSPGYPLDEAGNRERSAESFRRTNDPDGVTRRRSLTRAWSSTRAWGTTFPKRYGPSSCTRSPRSRKRHVTLSNSTM